MSILRQEYQKNKEEKEKVVTEAAVSWIDSNVIVINEKINRSSVNRLVSSIAKFEETFAPFKQRIPTISSIVDGCEENLQMVLTGKAGDKKTSEVLEYLSFVYNLFSSFFSKDLPVVLKARMFREAQENPAVRLDSLTGNFNIDAVAKTFAHAIEPSPEEMKLIGRVLKSKSIPKVDSKQIASELMALSYNDLVELTTMSKVPLVTTPKSLDQEDVVVSEAALLESRMVLLEASIEDVGSRIDALKKVVATTGFTPIIDPINKLHAALLAFEGSTGGQQLKQQFAQFKTSKNAGKITDLFKSPGGKLVKQANMAIELFNALGQAWPKLKSFTDKADPTEADINNIKAVITKAVSSGGLKKAAQALGVVTAPYPGLSPEEVINSILTSVTPEAGAAPTKEQVEPKLRLEAPTDPTTTPGTDPAKSLEQIKKIMGAFHKYSTTNSSATPSTPSSPTAGTQPQQQQNQGAEPAAGTSASTSPTEKGLGSNPQQKSTIDTPAKNTQNQFVSAMSQAGYTISNTKAKQVLDALQKAGYTFTKN